MTSSSGGERLADGDPRGFPIVRQPLPESLRYLAKQLHDGQLPQGVALALETLADGVERKESDGN